MTELNIEYAPPSEDEEMDQWRDRLTEFLRKYLSQPFDRGDASGWDWTQADLTMDDTWNDLDCSSIVPEDAVAILFQVNIRDASTGQYFWMRKNGNSNSHNRFYGNTIVADLRHSYDAIVFCDTDRKVEYKAEAAFDVIEIVIKGWFK